jgi:hypothetical protein
MPKTTAPKPNSGITQVLGTLENELASGISGVRKNVLIRNLSGFAKRFPADTEVGKKIRDLQTRIENMEIKK